MIRIETRRHGNPDIGIAPLVDCVFLLLIFFLLTSSFSETRGIKIDLPKSSTAQEAEKENIEIVMSETGEIVLQGRPTTINDLTKALRDAVARQGKRPVFLKADKMVRLEKVAEVIDCVRAAELETVSIATQRKRGKDPEE
ncbi:MAG: biopolymer transporter ExbD [Kiritimatiellae bacterium]|nr:biopolymer transporter ExbD [Kiritimatiellia bacterium]